MVEVSSFADKTLNMTIRHILENSIRHKPLRLVPELFVRMAAARQLTKLERYQVALFLKVTTAEGELVYY